MISNYEGDRIDRFEDLPIPTPPFTVRGFNSSFCVVCSVYLGIFGALVAYSEGPFNELPTFEWSLLQGWEVLTVVAIETFTIFDMNPA